MQTLHKVRHGVGQSASPGQSPPILQREARASRSKCLSSHGGLLSLRDDFLAIYFSKVVVAVFGI